MTNSTKGMMTWPLIIAAALIVVRIVVEQLGAPESLNNIFGVAWLYFLVPIYFGVHIARSGEARRFMALLKSVFLFTLYTRLMVIPTYWLAYALRWTAPRFGLERGGVVGEGVSPLEGYLWIPVRNAIFWIISATIVGLIFGGFTLLIRRKPRAATATS